MAKSYRKKKKKLTWKTPTTTRHIYRIQLRLEKKENTRQQEQPEPRLNNLAQVLTTKGTHGTLYTQCTLVQVSQKEFSYSLSFPPFFSFLLSLFLFHSFRFCNCSCRVELLPSCLGFHAISPTEISACLFHQRHKNPFFFFFLRFFYY
jgi:hypothetical protein